VAMFAVACVACLLHGVALAQARPGRRYVPQHRQSVERPPIGSGPAAATRTADTPVSN
jgi:hypothetical protein